MITLRGVCRPALALMSVLLVPCFAVGPGAQSVDWAADVRHVRDHLLANHPKLSHGSVRETFERAATELAAKAPRLSRSEVIVELARVVALIRDGHTQVGLAWDQKIGFRRYPIDLYWYSDGLFVRGAAPEHQQWVGARLVGIGTTGVDEVIERVKPIIHGDNEMKFLDVLPSRLLMAEVLHVLGLAGSADEATFVLEKNGKREAVRLASRPMGEPIKWVRARDASTNPLPLYVRDLSKAYAYEYLPESKVMYVRYSAVREDAAEPFAEFCRRLFADLARLNVERLVLDIRLNNGGDNTLYRPLLHGLIKAESINQPGRLYTIIGRLTFSAAVNLAADLEQHTATIFVGEPTAAPANHFGETQRLELPSSGISMIYSSLFWQSGHPADTRPWIPPTVPAALSFADYANNRDPMLEAILKLPRTQ